MRLLNTGPGNVYFNMALDEAIFLCHRKSLVPSTIRFYGWDKPAITFGYFQHFNKNQSIFGELDLPSVRRMTGGGTVLHCHEITFSIICLYNEVSQGGVRQSYRKISSAVAAGLKELGLEVCISETGFPGAQFCFSTIQPGDVVIKNRKLAGGAQKRSSGVLLHQGSILLEQNWDFARFSGAGISLSEAAGKKIMFDEVEEYILRGFREEFDIILEEGQLVEQEITLANKLIEKYKSPEWNKRY